MVISTLLSLAIIIALLAMLVNQAQVINCLKNTLEIQTAKIRLATERGYGLTNKITSVDIFGALDLRLKCPLGGGYNIGDTVGDMPTCSKHNIP